MISSTKKLFEHGRPVYFVQAELSAWPKIVRDQQPFQIFVNIFVTSLD
jgi:hypothetical protein